MKVERIPYFINKLAENPEDYERICQEEIDYLRQGYSSSEWGLSLHSLMRSYSRYRNQIKESFDGEEPVRYCQFFTLSEEENVKYVRDKTTARRDRMREMGRNTINPDELINTAQELIKAPGYYKIVLGLCLLTGRRPTELLYSGKLFPSHQKTEAYKYAEEYLGSEEHRVLMSEVELERRLADIGDCEWVFFAGQLKQTDSIWRAPQPFPIPLLAPVDRVLEAFDKLRRIKNFESLSFTKNDVANGLTFEDKIHQLTSSELNKQCKKIYRDLLPAKSLIVKSLRAAYATICYDWFADCSEALYFSLILGHRQDSEATAASYRIFSID